MNRKDIGDQAEAAAARLLVGKGLRIVEKNFRCKTGEIDLIAEDGETLVFVEVRARSSSGFGTAAETVGPAKRRKIIKTAQFYLQSRGLGERAARFDVVAFDGGQAEHIPGAFSADSF